MNFQRFCFAILAFVALVAVGSGSATCSTATLTGVWGYFLGGGVGQFTADGNGNITAGSQTVSNGGTILNQTFTGTYTVATNCTGTLTLNIAGGGTFTGSFVLDQMNKGAQLIETVAGADNVGFAAAEGTVVCGLTGKGAPYAAFLLGKIVSSNTKVDYVFRFVLNGSGKVSGSGTFVEGGTVTPASISGTYTESSNCTGAAAITAGPYTFNFNFVVAASGKELFAIETDNGTSVTGFMQE